MNPASPMSAHLIPMAASVLICRPGAGPDAPPAVLAVRRSPSAPFMSGFWAFPGGRHDAADGPREAPDAAVRTVVRETWEEVGLALDPTRLVPLGYWRTPDYLVAPMHTHFFLYGWPAGTPLDPRVDGVELVECAWRTADDLLADWAGGRLLLAPPTQFLLGALARGFETLPARALAGPWSQGVPPRFARVRPDVTLFPLRTPTLPPATHTNAYVVGRERLVVVDPASPDPGEQAALLEYLDARCAGGARVEAVVLTHAHHDHIAAAPAVSARFGARILAHPDAAARLPFPAEGVLLDGERVPAGDTALTVVATPGHAPGHVVFFEPGTRTALVGDLVAGIGTILVDPDEGSMADYFAALARVRALDCTALLPAHGGVIGGAREKLTEYIQHRLWREGRIVEALSAGPADLETLLPRVYSDVAQGVMPIARMSLRAHLVKLQAEGRVSVDGATWSAVVDGVSGGVATR
jgi:ribonuclease/clavin/mitogillin